MIAKDDMEPIIRRRMRRRGLQQTDIDFFIEAWRTMDREAEELDWGKLSTVQEEDVITLPKADSEEGQLLHEIGLEHIHQCAVVKLNGGRSTTMGGQVPKCMVTAKDGKNFLEITMGQIMAANDRYGVEMPLVLMNSFFTDHVTEKILGRTPLIVLNFIQNEYPRIKESNLRPLDTGTDMDWCPAGHGDFFASIESSGLLDSLLEEEMDIRYVFISNIDNLSAEISPEILGAMVDGKHDFMMEVTRKTPADVKGGSPVFNDGKLFLLEIAQVPDAHRDDFQDIEEFRYFNTNNIWIDLTVLREKRRQNSLGLPIILNRKHIAETDVIQIETAMGAGIQSFPASGLIEVPRTRFAPVKKLSDLFVVQSDVYLMDEEFRLSLNPDRPDHLPPLPNVEFHSGFPKDNELQASFADPSSVSLLEAESLSVGGDVFLEKDLQIKGTVTINQEGGEEKRIGQHHLDELV